MTPRRGTFDFSSDNNVNRLTSAGLESIIAQHKSTTPLSLCLSLSQPQQLKFIVGVLIDILEDGEWYTVQVIGAKKGALGEEAHLNYMVDG